MSRVIERIIDVEGREDGIGVRSDPYDRTVVRWFCGEKRSFTPEDLEQTIDDLELLSEFPDVWLQCRDTNGSSFTAQVVDGELYANTGPTAGGHVPWKTLKKTLKKMG